jgi:hypothetical protein
MTTVLLISDEALPNSIDEYKSSKKLEPGSEGPEEKLSIDQSHKLKACFAKIYSPLCKDIVNYVEMTFGVFYLVYEMRN